VSKKKWKTKAHKHKWAYHNVDESIIVNKGKGVVKYRLLAVRVLTFERQVEARVAEELAKGDVL
jgi:hypothetical protein